MPLRVVDELEVVEVDEQHARDPSGPPGGGDLLGYPVLEQQSVGQPGQGVVESPVLQLLLELVLPGHVPEGEHKAGHVRLGAQVAAPGLDVHDPAVEPGDPLFHDARAGPRAFPQPHEGTGEVSRSCLRDKLPETLAHRGDVTEDATVDGVAYLTVPSSVGDHDGVRGVLDQGAEVGLVALADHLLAEHDALKRQRDLVRQQVKRPRQVGQDALFPEYRDQAGRDVSP